MITAIGAINGLEGAVFTAVPTKSGQMPSRPLLKIAGGGHKGYLVDRNPGSSGEFRYTNPRRMTVKEP